MIYNSYYHELEVHGESDVKPKLVNVEVAVDIGDPEQPLEQRNVFVTTVKITLENGGTVRMCEQDFLDLHPEAYHIINTALEEGASQ